MRTAEPLELVPCPECGAIAEIRDEFTLRGTGGPVMHVVTSCVAGHHLTPRLETVQREDPCRAALRLPGEA